MGIERLDKNFIIPSALDLPDVRWYDVRKAPFKIYGLYKPETEERFRRMPKEVSSKVNEGVALFGEYPTGGRIRFKTNSKYIAIKVECKNEPMMGHICRVGMSGLDLYISESGEKHHFKNSFIPAWNVTDGFENYVYCSDGEKLLDCVINMPNYDYIDNLYLGFSDSATVESGEEYKHTTPVVFLGSSITQGGCASRPGNCYVNMLSRELDTDIINLGFSGSCRGEQILSDYVASLNMAVFVCDYDHNAPTPNHLRDTHLPLYKTFRAKQPETPIIFITKPDWINDPNAAARRQVVLDTYNYALEKGDKNVYFVDGKTLWEGLNPNDCTVDGCHPNDLGFFRMFEKICPVLEKLL